MALCLAHAAAGYVAYEALRPAGRHDVALLATAVVAANLPDADFLPGLAVGHATAFHRGATHTMAAAVVLTWLVWVAARWGRSMRPVLLAGVAGAAYATHLLLDWMTVDAVPPPGIQLLWPLSDAWMHAPWSVLGEIIVDSRSRLGFVQSLLTPRAVETWVREVGVVVGVVALVHLARGMAALRAPVCADESLEGQGDA